MIKIRKGVIVFALIVIAAHFILIDYSELSWKENSVSYLGIIVMIFIIISMIFSNRHERRSIPDKSKKSI